MSKIIESLKASVGERPSSHEMTQQQLADIYFSSADKPRQHSDQPLVIRVVERRGAAGLLPWGIAALAFLLMAMALFSTKRVFIDVRVMDDKMLRLSEWQGPAAGDAGSPAARREGPTEAPAGERMPMDDFVFEGAARIRSSQNRSEMILVNSSIAPFARASLNFRKPVDLSAARIVFYARGARGGETLAFSVTDRGNRLAFEKGKMRPFGGPLTTEWQRAEVPLQEGLAEGFDARSVTSLRFDFGSKDLSNRADDTILIRDLRIMPA